MRHIFHIISIGCLMAYAVPALLYAKKSTEIKLEPDVVVTANDAQEESPSFRFEFQNEPLSNIINQIAAAKDVNIILPRQPIDAKVTFALDHPVTKDRAWELLQTLLDVSGYAIKPQESLYTIIPITGNIFKEPMPTFIGTPVDQLPDTDQWIRYIYYFANLQVSDAADSELNKIVEALLPVGSKRLVDPLTNALIMVSKSNDIKAAMEIVSQLDKAGFQEKMEIIVLHHTQARMIADLFKQQILPEEAPGQVPANRFRLDARKPSDAYFSPHTRIIAEERRNALIVLGRAQAVDRLKDFITNYIDVELDSGKSVLHIYKLQYLDAKQAEEVLKKVVESAQIGGTEQSRAGQATPSSGPQRFFEEVIILADTPEKVEEAGSEYFGYQKSTDGSKTIKYQYAGGNKLVVAARNSDWNVIKKLIEEIDQPQPQVLIEVLIADLTLDDTRQLGAETRNPAKINMPGDINIQSAQLTNPLVNDTTNPTSIKTDLLRNITSTDVPNLSKLNPPLTSAPSIATLATAGSSIIEFNDNDGRTWSLLQVLQSFGQTKIISHPHVISTNNKDALISLGQERLVTGAADTGNTAANVRKEKIQANLTVTIKPRISGGIGGSVNLSVTIDIQEFRGGNDQRIVRRVQTQANVRDSNILALGGLIRTEDSVGLREMPILGRVPILGWLFKNRIADNIKTNLTVFIKPTIIMPRLRRGVNQYTKDYLEVAKQYAQEGDLFDGLQEPITRWFFKTGTPATEMINEFIKKDEYQRIDNPQEEAPTARQRRKLRKAQQTVTPSPEESQELKKLINSDDNPLLTKGRKKKTARAQL